MQLLDQMFLRVPKKTRQQRFCPYLGFLGGLSGTASRLVQVNLRLDLVHTNAWDTPHSSRPSSLIIRTLILTSQKGDR